MRVPCGRAFCGVVLALAAAAGPGLGQAGGTRYVVVDDPAAWQELQRQKESHVEIPLEPQHFQNFRSQLSHVAQMGRMPEALRGADPGDIFQNEQLRRQLGEILKQNGGNLPLDEQSRKLLESILNGQTMQPGEGTPAPSLGNLQQLLKKLESLRPDPQNAGGGPANPLGGDPMQRITRGANVSSGRAQPGQFGGFTPPPPPDQRTTTESDPLQSWLLKQAERFNDMGGQVGNSGALQDAIRSVQQSTLSLDPTRLRSPNVDSFVGKQLTGLGRNWHPERLLTRLDVAGPLSRWSGPGLRNFRLPHWGLPTGNLPGVAMPTFGTPAAGGADSAGGMLWLLGVVSAGLGVWLLYHHVRLSRDRQHERRPTRWPVRPDAVMSREQLIQAFEFLSLSRLGPESRSWNHREIAVGLGGRAFERRQAADRLADLYEQARYAPDQGPLPELALATARRELTFLAGVATG